MSDLNKIKLSQFYIIHRDLDVVDEGADAVEREDKLLLFHPDVISLDEKLTVSSLVEGIYDFSKSIAVNDGVDTLFMTDNIHIIEEVEPGILFVATLTYPKASSEKSSGLSFQKYFSPATSDENSTNSSTNKVPATSDKLHVSTLEELECDQEKQSASREATIFFVRQIIRRVYSNFVLFHGKIQSSLDGKDRCSWSKIQNLQNLRKQRRKAQFAADGLNRNELDRTDVLLSNRAASLRDLNIQVTAAEESSPLPQLKKLLESNLLPNILRINWASLHLFHSMGGIHYLPVKQTMFLAVQHFMNLLSTDIEAVDKCALVFNDYLVWSSIEEEGAMSSILDYMLSPSIVEFRSSAADGGFLLEDNSGALISPRIHLPAYATATATTSKRIQTGDKTKNGGNYSQYTPKISTSSISSSSVNLLQSCDGESACSHNMLIYQSGLCSLVVLIRRSSIKKKIKIRIKKEENISEKKDGHLFAGVVREIASSIASSVSLNLRRLNVDLNSQFEEIVKDTGYASNTHNRFFFYNSNNSAIRVLGLCTSIDKALMIAPLGESLISSPPTRNRMCSELDNALAQALNILHYKLWKGYNESLSTSYADSDASSTATQHSTIEGNTIEIYQKIGPSYGWARGILANGRELITVVSSKSSSLRDAVEEMEEVENAYFGHILLI